MGRPTVGRGSRVRENKGLAGLVNDLVRIGLVADGCDRAVVDIQRLLHLCWLGPESDTEGPLLHC